MNDVRLDQLIADRRSLVEIHRRNNFTDGIHSLLSDLYPDVAHYLYELLQNAEDMDATQARFILNADGLRFEHNGTKRDFTIQDIDAITNIGFNLLKKDDKTSIGKFGVGFKAVFPYTSTPEIHSGPYYFRIRDYFIPDFDDVPELKTEGEDGQHWTTFILPFNGRKTQPTAFAETQEGLLDFDDSTILFLTHLKRISYEITDADGDTVSGSVTRTENEPGVFTIETESPEEKKTSSWIRLQEMRDFTDEHGNKKKLPLAVAFSLKGTDRQSMRIVPTHGRTFIYFPTEKESNGLRFHVNAPFASTVARDSVRSCTENSGLMDDLSEFVADSIEIVRDMGMLTN